jgi:predicted molibdopterin-dependent oxidoreductase YjgC
MSNSVVEIEDTDLLLIFGYNPADSHPIVANRVINAQNKKGQNLLSAIRGVLKPRASPISTSQLITVPISRC